MLCFSCEKQTNINDEVNIKVENTADNFISDDGIYSLEEADLTRFSENYGAEAVGLDNATDNLVQSVTEFLKAKGINKTSTVVEILFANNAEKGELSIKYVDFYDIEIIRETMKEGGLTAMLSYLWLPETIMDELETSTDVRINNKKNLDNGYIMVTYTIE